MGQAYNYDGLRQLQSLPLKYKIRMTEERIKAWYESWVQYEILDLDTQKTRTVTIDTRGAFMDPPMKDSELVMAARPGQVYLSFSGGKDSTVLRHIVKSLYEDVPAVFVDTGLEYPEVRKFATQHADVVLRPKMRFDEVIKTYGYPVATKRVADAVEGARRNPNSTRAQQMRGEYGGRRDGKQSKFSYTKWLYLMDAPFKISAKCCDVMKKQPIKKYGKETGRMPIIGTLASESQARKAEWFKSGCNAFNSPYPTSRPLSFWTEQDILQYIKEHDLQYASVYGDIVEDDAGQLRTTDCDRTGCMFCCFGCHLEDAPNRFQRMKETHPRQYEYCMRPIEEKGLGLQEVLDYIGVDYQ